MNRQRKRQLILDKSYLQGAPSDAIERLCDEFHVIMPSALLFELLTTDKPEEATRCFRKIPARDNPLVLVDNVGSLLRYENRHQRPAAPLAARAARFPYAFNPQLTAGTFVLTPEQQEGVGHWQADIQADVIWFKKLHATASGWFPEIAAAARSQQHGVVSQLKQTVASDTRRLRYIYSKIRRPSYPKTQRLSSGWVHFRHLQVHLIAALEYLRPGATLPNDSKLENEVADLEYRVMAAAAGGFATQDPRCKEVFRLLSPSGLLIEHS